MSYWTGAFHLFPRQASRTRSVRLGFSVGAGRRVPRSGGTLSAKHSGNARARTNARPGLERPATRQSQEQLGDLDRLLKRPAFTKTEPSGRAGPGPSALPLCVSGLPELHSAGCSGGDGAEALVASMSSPTWSVSTEKLCAGVVPGRCCVSSVRKPLTRRSSLPAKRPSPSLRPGESSANESQPSDPRSPPKHNS